MNNTILNRNFYIGIIAFCLTVMAVCYAYGVHLGLNTRITAGFELDASNISIALSRLWFGLHEGYVGYQQVYTALFHVLVPDSNPNNPVNFALLSDSHILQKAFDNVRAIAPAMLPQYSVLSPEFVSVNLEDHGLADFYTLAFMIFGVHPTAMYNFYFLVFIASLALFIIEYRKQLFPLVLIGIMVGVFPVFFFSHDNFPVFIPSVNANRFMATLGFIPVAHILCMYFSPLLNLNRFQVIRIIAQGLIFTFAVSIRSATKWELIALVLFVLYMGTLQLWPYRKKLFELERLRLLLHPVLASMLVFFITITIYQKIQDTTLNPVYHTDSAPTGHAIWHSAYLSLGLHPKWAIANPEHPGFGDGTAFKFFEDYMKKKGLDPVSHITNTYAFGLHEIVIKQEFFRFIQQHKRFTLMLYGYYKPRILYAASIKRLSHIDKACLIYCLAISILGGLFLTRQSIQKKVYPLKLMITATLFLFGSWLPLIFAYATPYNNDDLWMFAIYICLGISIITFSLVKRLRINYPRS